MAGAGGGGCPAGGNDLQWCFSQVKGAIDEDVAEGSRAAARLQRSLSTSLHVENQLLPSDLTRAPILWQSCVSLMK